MANFEPRPAASIHTVGCRMTPTHQQPEPETEPETDTDEEQVEAKVVRAPRRKSPHTGEAETK